MTCGVVHQEILSTERKESAKVLPRKYFIKLNLFLRLEEHIAQLTGTMQICFDTKSICTQNQGLQIPPTVICDPTSALGAKAFLNKVCPAIFEIFYPRNNL
jgi:hypothetical protein